MDAAASESLLLAIGALVAGLVLLLWSADRFIAGAAATAQHLGMTPLMIGLTVVSLVPCAEIWSQRRPEGTPPSPGTPWGRTSPILAWC